MGEWAIRVKDLRKQYPGRNGPVHAVKGSTWRSSTASASACSAPTGRARRPPSRSWRGSISRPRARSRSWACAGHRRRRNPRADRRQRSRKRGFPTRRRCARSCRCFGASTSTGLDPEDVIARVSLESKANAFIEQLSGGQQQRLAVALRPGRRPRGAVPGRADDRAGPAITPPALGRDPRPARPGPHGRAHDPLHGRGRAALRPGGDHRSGQDHRPGLARRADRPAGGRPHRRVRPGSRGAGQAVETPSRSSGSTRYSRRGSRTTATSLTVAEPHRAIPALLDELDRSAAAAGPAHDPARQPGRRLRLADRPPPARRSKTSEAPPPSPGARGRRKRRA